MSQQSNQINFSQTVNTNSPSYNAVHSVFNSVYNNSTQSQTSQQLGDQNESIPTSHLDDQNIFAPNFGQHSLTNLASLQPIPQHSLTNLQPMPQYSLTDLSNVQPMPQIDLSNLQPVPQISLTNMSNFQPIPQWPQQSGPSLPQTFHPNQSFAPNFGQNSSDQNTSQGAFGPIFGQNKFNKNKKGPQTSQKRPNANPDDPSAPKKPKAKPKILTDIDIPR